MKKLIAIAALATFGLVASGVAKNGLAPGQTEPVGAKGGYVGCVSNVHVILHVYICVSGISTSMETVMQHDASTHPPCGQPTASSEVQYHFC